MRKICLAIVVFEAGRGLLKMEGYEQEAESLQKLEKMRNGFSSTASRKNATSADILILGQRHLFWTSGLQNANIINLYCFKPPNCGTGKLIQPHLQKPLFFSFFQTLPIASMKHYFKC